MAHAESLHHTAASVIPCGTAGLDPVKSSLLHQIIQEAADGGCYDPAPLNILSQPVTDHGCLVLLIDGIGTGHPGEFTMGPNAKMSLPSLRQSPDRSSDEILRILRGTRSIDKGQPRIQVIPVHIHQPIQLPSMMRLQPLEIHIFPDSFTKHFRCQLLSSAKG